MNENAGLKLSPDGAAWLDQFRSEDGVAMISDNRPYMHLEADYDSQYGNHDLDDSGAGVVNLLRKFDCDFGGPILEIGCGTGTASLGLCKTTSNPWFLVTDSSSTFLDITRRKLARNHVDLDRVRFAVLADKDLNRLPPDSVSAIVLRSVVHHFTDVPGWIREAAPTLRPGGMIVCEEPCSQGYLLMGLVAEAIAQSQTSGLSPEQLAKARLLADTMKAYNRQDVDKSQWEDKHLFRPEDMSKWAEAAGLQSTFLPSTTFDAFARDPDGAGAKTDFVLFFESYLQYCMNYGAADAACISAAAMPLLRYAVEACSGTREPYLMGLFLLRKPRRLGTTSAPVLA